MKMTPTATRRQWRRPWLRRQRGDDSTARNSAITMRKEGRKTYIEQLECIVTKPQTVLALSPEQVVALPPPDSAHPRARSRSSKLLREDDELRQRR
ncbi:hypothetical protein EDB85DRAFT_2227643 [Lactarius pseudohatsudake]|nr:hypothetical protein EDB85DRAFT_2227643 [Lactarius pseudohatsudake]